MNKKYTLKPWVKNTIGEEIIFILLSQLSLINSKLNKIINQKENSVIIEMRYNYGQ